MPGEMTRRKFLEAAAASAIAAAGFGAEKHALAEEPEARTEQKEQAKDAAAREIERAARESFERIFSWIAKKEYGGAERAEGRKGIADFILEKMRRHEPDAVVFGETHGTPEVAHIFMDIVEQDPKARLFAEEATGHLSGREEYRGLLNTRIAPPEMRREMLKGARDLPKLRANRRPLSEDEIRDTLAVENRIAAIVKAKGISLSLLHKPFFPEKETIAKALGLRDAGERAIFYTGAFHAMTDPFVAPGRFREYSQRTYADEARRVLGREAVFGVNGGPVEQYEAMWGEALLYALTRTLSDRRVPYAAVRDVFLTRIRGGAAEIARDKASASFPRLYWFDNRREGLLLTVEPGQERFRCASDATAGIDALLSFPMIVDALADKKKIFSYGSHTVVTEVAHGRRSIVSIASAGEDKVVLSVRTIMKTPLPSGGTEEKFNYQTFTAIPCGEGWKYFLGAGD